MKKTASFQGALCVFLSLIAPAIYSSDVESTEFKPITTITAKYHEGITPLDEKALEKFKLRLELPVELGVTDFESIPEGDDSIRRLADFQRDQTLQLLDSTEVEADKSYIVSFHQVIFGPDVGALERVHMNNSGAILVEIAADSPESVVLVNQLYEEAGIVATNFMAGIRAERIKSRVEEDVRDGLREGRYDVDTLYKLKNSGGASEVYAELYSRIPVDAQKEDAQWMQRATKSVENNIRLGILRAVVRTNNLELRNLIQAATSEHISSPIYQYAVQQNY